MPRNYFHGKLIDGGSFEDLTDTSLIKAPNRVLTGRNFYRSKLVGGQYFGGVDSSEFVSGVTDLSIGTTGLRFVGQDILLDINALTIEPSNIEFTGQDIALNISNTLSIESGAITFTGEDVLLPKVLPIEVGTLSFTGQNIDIAPPVDLSIESSSLSFTGQDIDIGIVVELTIEASSMSFTGDEINIFEDGTYDITLHTARALGAWVFYSNGEGSTIGADAGALSPIDTYQGATINEVAAGDTTSTPSKRFQIWIAGNRAQSFIPSVIIETTNNRTLAFDADDVVSHSYNSGADATHWIWDTESISTTDSVWDDDDLGITHLMEIKPISLARTCTLEESGSSVGYRNYGAATYGSVSDSSFGSDTVVALRGTTGGSTDLFGIDIDNTGLADDAFDELRIELTSGIVVFLNSADASTQIINGVQKRWQWQGNNYWVSADDGSIVSWDIV